MPKGQAATPAGGMKSAPEKGCADAREIAARLWPGPDPRDFCKREAVASLVAFDEAIEVVLGLRARAYSRLFEDLGRLWIRPTPSEDRLRELRQELCRALNSVTDAIDRLDAARVENEIRLIDERLLDRIERGVSTS